MSQNLKYCKDTQAWYFIGYSTGHRYWGRTAREAEQKAQLYFYR